MTASEKRHCGHCGTEVAKQAVACLSCGAAPATGRGFCQACGAQVTNPNAMVCLSCGSGVGATGLGKAIRASSPPKDPLLMALLSGCIIAGLGQIILGQVTKGVTLLLGSVVLAFVTAGFSALITWPLIGIDAYLVASRLKEGRTLGEWDFFPSQS